MPMPQSLVALPPMPISILAAAPVQGVEQQLSHAPGGGVEGIPPLRRHQGRPAAWAISNTAVCCRGSQP